MNEIGRGRWEEGDGKKDGGRWRKKKEKEEEEEGSRGVIKHVNTKTCPAGWS